jgi:hypothetical protein
MSTYECDNDNHNVGCQCEGIMPNTGEIGFLTFEKELTKLINKYSLDATLNTPDFVIASAMRQLLPLLSVFNMKRDGWWGFVPEIGNPHMKTEPKPNRFKDVTDIESLIYQAVGAGSVCWENPGGAGVFDDQKARDVSSEDFERLAQLYVEGNRAR